MINSAVYRLSNINVDILDQSQIASSTAKVEASQIEKSSVIYFLQAYLHQLLMKKEKSLQQKNLSCRELGKNIGYKLAEVLSEGSFDRFLTSKEGKDLKPVKYVHEVKFLCEKVWSELFNRKVDKLQFAAATNTFTFQDNSFRLIQHISHPVYETEQEFIGLNFEVTCGIIEGVLNRFGHEVEVKYQDKAHSEFEVRFKTPGDTHFFSTY